MAFDTLIRNGIALADSLTAVSLQPTIQHAAWAGQDRFGAATYATTANIDALVEYKNRLHQTADGRIVQTQAKITILRPLTPNGATGRKEPIDPRDKITLPDGSIGPIVDVEGFIDPTINRPYMLEIWIGLIGAGFGT